jgi:hypothetical protein
VPAAFRRLAAAALLALAGLALPAVAAPVEANAQYTVTLGGTQIGIVDIVLRDDGKGYAMSIAARITGMAQFVASGSIRGQSAGVSTATGLRSQKFDLTTRAQGQEFNVAITYAGQNVDTFVVTPPVMNNIDRVAIERKHLTGVNDMVAGFVLKGGALDRSLCDRRIPVFNGIERFNLAMSFARAEEATSKRTGYQGPVVLCSIGYTPVSGHYTTNELTSFLQQSGRIFLWYAPLATPGYFIPYRGLVSTSAGDLSVVLTKLTQ